MFKIKMKYFFIIIVFFWGPCANGQQIFNIWQGAAPGSESWNWPEQKDSLEWANDMLVYNVTQPNLTYYPADSAVASGAAVIICPGGSFSYLHVDTEGSEVAKWLNKKGIAAFVLKYRLVHSFTAHPVKEKNVRAADTAQSRKLYAQLIPMAIADARAAISYVRKHAGLLNIVPNKIGILGFSAGGTLAVASAFNYGAENRPDFLMSLYAYVPPSLQMTLLKDAPPIFIAAATDDELHLVPMCLDLYNKWLAAGQSAEIHIYSKGGHGFGMNKNNQPSDTWIERLGDWLQIRGLMNRKN